MIPDVTVDWFAPQLSLKVFVSPWRRFAVPSDGDPNSKSKSNSNGMSAGAVLGRFGPRWLLRSFVSPCGASDFSLLAQRKVTKRKGTPVGRRCAVPSLRAVLGVRADSASCLDAARPAIQAGRPLRATLRSAPSDGDPNGNSHSHSNGNGNRNGNAFLTLGASGARP